MQTNSYELRDYLAILWNRRLAIALVTAGVFAVALVYSLQQPARYQSTGVAQVYPLSLPIEGAASQSFVPMENELAVAESSSVAQLAVGHMPAGEPLASISVTNPTNTQTLVFTATSGSPQVAADTAEAYALAYLDSRQESFTGSAQKAEAELQTQIDAITLQIDDLKKSIQRPETSPAEQQAIASQISSLTTRQSNMQSTVSSLQLIQTTEVGRILADATVPSSPAGPDHRRAGALGLFVGLALGVAVALVLERLDRRLRDRVDVEEAALAPIVAYVPNEPKLARWLAFEPAIDHHVADGYRTLRTRITFAASQEPVQTVLVTSARLSEGKTTTAANLALALARVEAEVVLVSADPRRPDVERYFPSPTNRGLADVLSGQAELSRVLVRTRFPNLTLLPSGSVHSIPEGGLNSDLMRTVFEGLTSIADFVIVDGPPVLGLSETLDMAPLVDRVLLVANAQRTTRDDLASAGRELRSVGGNVLGVVIGNVDQRRVGSHFRMPVYPYDQRSTGVFSRGAGRVHAAPDPASVVVPDDAGLREAEQ
jgi:capsular exopolysaccharide synthesis family protein